MNRNRFFIGLLIVIFLVVLLWQWPREKARVESKQSQSLPTSSSTNAPVFQEKSESAAKPSINAAVSREADKEHEEKMWNLAFMTPISFYGKVVDEKGEAVSDAVIKFSAADKPFGGSKYEKKSDKNGQFSITGINGLSLVVDVSKDGYYRLKESGGVFGYAKGTSSDGPLPSSDNPAIFVLRKMGVTEPLVRITQQVVRVAKNGTPIEIDLETGRVASAGQGDLKVECWTNDQNKDEKRHYDWNCRLSIASGGLIERKDQFEFEAPIEGYQSYDEINMTRSTDPWRKDIDREYFAKLANNKYARFKFQLTTGGEHFFVIESYLNPTSGSRNLEYDPAKAIKP